MSVDPSQLDMEQNSLTRTTTLFTVANFVGGGVVSAFFASLDRCSCINLTTSDLDDGDDNALMFTTSARHDDLHHSIVAAPTPASVDKLAL